MTISQDCQYYLPPEWDPHLATILGFPSKASTSKFLYEALCNEIMNLAAAISDFEPVRLYARPEDAPTAQFLIDHMVHGPYQITVIPIPTNHCWVRDTGPVYVFDALKHTQRLAIWFKFNEWGNKNGWPVGSSPDDPYATPAMTKPQLLENTHFGRNVIVTDDSPSPVQLVPSSIITEGGGLIVDGEGTLLISESYMVCNERNTGLSRDTIEEELRRLLGVGKVIWFPGRKGLDITDDHLDGEVRFVRPGVVVMTRHHPDGPQEFQKSSSEMLEILQRETDARGRRFEIHMIDEPGPKDLPVADADEFVASYVNFYFCNGALIIPRFGVEEYDRKACETLQALLPDKWIRQVHVNAIPLNGGVIHCVTQQVPALPEVYSN